MIETYENYYCVKICIQEFSFHRKLGELVLVLALRRQSLALKLDNYDESGPSRGFSEDGLGVENLSGSGAIASAYSRAYHETFTLTYVARRSCRHRVLILLALAPGAIPSHGEAESSGFPITERDGTKVKTPKDKGK
ncbi:Acetyl-CoA Carboxylase [Datura stramonium]|uniref:Acetyl-CoA Carboxylase n=1 Tax=Datura stramonium TaxID=4076 RepID=A0ABS8SFN9_DATST|nr:Acetyl-CoA Carboxylase [Datura stramonium]